MESKTREELKESEVVIMYRIAIIIVIALAVLGARDAAATTISFYDDGVIQNGDEYDIVSVFNDATVGMTGGLVWDLYANDSSTFNLFDGLVYLLYPRDSSTINIYGGSIDWAIGIGDSSVVNLFGGQVATDVGISDSGMLNIYGYGFEYQPTGTGSGTLSGYWLDGTPFSGMYFRMLAEPFPGSQVTLIPEPATLLFLSLGGVILRRRMVSR